MWNKGALLAALLLLGATARAEEQNGAEAPAGQQDTARAEAPAGQQDAARAAARDEARTWFVKARSDFEAKRYKAALEALRRSHELQRLSLLLRFMGDCYFELGEYDLAISHYRRYRNRAPDAADSGYVEKRLAQAEGLARQQREQELNGRRVPTRLMPTGKDRENPLRPGQPVLVSGSGPDDRHRSWLTVSKWSTLAAGVAGLAMGITFNRLAAAKADELRQAVRSACPPGEPGCTGNPDLDAPVAAYSLEHYELQRQLNRNNAIAITSFVVGGVAAASSAVLFWLDRDTRRRQRARRVSVTPVLGAGSLGAAGEVSF